MTVSGEDELLPDPRERRGWGRIGRLRTDLVIGAVIIAGLVGLGRAMSHGDGPTETPPSPTPSASVRTFGTGAPDSGSGLLNGSTTGATGSDPAACPTAFGCVVTDHASAPQIAAILAAFPAALLQSVTSVQLGQPIEHPRLWFLQINARFGDRRLLVRLQRPTPGDLNRQGVVANGSDRRITFYENQLRRYHVMVQLDAPNALRPPTAQVQRLARDVRLLDLG